MLAHQALPLGFSRSFSSLSAVGRPRLRARGPAEERLSVSSRGICLCGRMGCGGASAGDSMSPVALGVGLGLAIPIAAVAAYFFYRRYSSTAFSYHLLPHFPQSLAPA